MFEDVITRYFSRELIARTKELGLKKWYIAYYCEISEKTITECFNGERLPTVWQLILMAEMCHCTVNDLLGYRYFRIGSTELASSIPQAVTKLPAITWNRVKEIMQRNGITIVDLSERTGIPVRNISSWFERRNEKYPKTMDFLRIYDALNCTPSDLLGY